MIHHPDPWLALLINTSAKIKQGRYITSEDDFAGFIIENEFSLHQSMFAIRKIDECIGIDLKLKTERINATEWPSQPATVSEICRSTSPDLKKWYDLQNSKPVTLTQERAVNVFIHARICTFCLDLIDGFPVGGLSVFIGSDHTIHKGIYSISFVEINMMIQRVIGVFEPIVVARNGKSA